MALFQRKVEREYQAYKDQTLKMPPNQIWDRCCEIFFYSCVHEYFMYNERISYVVAKSLGKCDDIISGCWNLYLKNEALSILSWEDIDELIEKYLKSKGENV